MPEIPRIHDESQHGADPTPHNPELGIMPVMPSSALEALLRDKKYADFRLSYSEGLSQLMRAILGREPIPPEVHGALIQLRSEDRMARHEAEHRLNSILWKERDSGGTAVANVVVDSLDLNDPARAEILISMFGRLKIVASLPKLIQALKSKDSELRRLAAIYLPFFEDEIVVEPLAELIGDRKKEVRFAALEALGKIGGTRAWACLQGAWVKAVASRRREIASGIVSFFERFEYLAKELLCDNPKTREILSDVWLEVADYAEEQSTPTGLGDNAGGSGYDVTYGERMNWDLATSLPTLSHALNDSNPVVRKRIARVLGAIVPLLNASDHDVLDALERAKEGDSDDGVRRAAESSIQQIHNSRGGSRSE